MNAYFFAGVPSLHSNNFARYKWTGFSGGRGWNNAVQNEQTALGDFPGNLSKDSTQRPTEPGSIKPMKVIYWTTYMLMEFAQK